MQNYQTICLIISLILSSEYVFATEFTFDLPDSAEQCFHEVIELNISSIFEFQVRGPFEQKLEHILPFTQSKLGFKKILVLFIE